MSTTEHYLANLIKKPHSRVNILTGERVLVSPQRNKRPWQGKIESVPAKSLQAYESTCYLCPGNTRADGTVNPAYPGSFGFKNDYSALLQDTYEHELNDKDLLIVKGERGICEVIAFSPRHDLTIPELELSVLENLVTHWSKAFKNLSEIKWIKYIQIFENKGDVMGCSNPHPHGQIWAQGSIPVEIEKETRRQQAYYERNNKGLLESYLELELEKQERVVFQNDHFVVLVPFWAVWPFETMIISKRRVPDLLQFTLEEKNSLADALKRLTTRYDNLFETSFPYSAGMHQAPVNDGDHPEWHWHMHFYPPLLRSATIKKFMVGYELLANAQRDITPEYAAQLLKEASENHYKLS